ncbi:expressed unknown protein [Seminavis robusta]|uniref:Uncharacterized protein n=1 Tax=Seminavis robusta TaxID=568900 RepID=A0A9N8H5Q0_9STRA|nr:expressed unknown protein [Seminavis robusta]|eukprot:Sro28_g018650.1 n/a (363) ;mRNA; f:53288-54376
MSASASASGNDDKTHKRRNCINKEVLISREKVKLKKNGKLKKVDKLKKDDKLTDTCMHSMNGSKTKAKVTVNKLGSSFQKAHLIEKQKPQKEIEKQRRRLRQLDYRPHNFYDHAMQQDIQVGIQQVDVQQVQVEYTFWTSKQSILIGSSLLLALTGYKIFFYGAFILFLYETGCILQNWKLFLLHHHIIREFKKFSLSWWYYTTEQIVQFLDTKNDYSRKAALGFWIMWYPRTSKMVKNYIKDRKEQMLQLAKEEAQRLRERADEAIKQAETVMRRSSLTLQQLPTRAVQFQRQQTQRLGQLTRQQTQRFGQLTRQQTQRFQTFQRQRSRRQTTRRMQRDLQQVRRQHTRRTMRRSEWDDVS